MTIIIKKNTSEIDERALSQSSTPMKGSIIGLTGNIACGKSTAGSILSDLHLTVLDADRISFELSQRDGDAYQQMLQAFGEQIIGPHYNLDRKKLRGIIFNDLEKRKKLESILHPAIEKRTRELALECFHRGEKVVIYEAPLLIEAGYDKSLDGLLLITCDSEKQLQRILTRDSTITKELAQKIMAAQLSQDEKRKHATWIIENDGTVEELREKLKEWSLTVTTSLKNH